MGTKGSFSGSGGPIAESILDGLDDWLASLPGAGHSPAASPSETGELSDAAKRLLPTIGLFRTVGGGGGGSRDRARDRGQSTRSTATSAGAAGRGAAAAYAFRSGDADALRELGLDYNTLRSYDNIFDVVNEIAQAVCANLPLGTIEGDELLIVVGDLAEWIISTGDSATPPPLENIAREAVAMVMANAYLVETARTLNHTDLTAKQRATFESDVRLTCEELAGRADLSADAPTAAQFTAAIQEGLEFLASIYKGGIDG